MHVEQQHLTIKEVAYRLNVSDDTIRRAIAAGELQAVRIGRVWRIPPASLPRPGEKAETL